MLPDIYYINPYSLTRHYGKELNKHIKCFPKDSWIVVTDHDVMFLTPGAGITISNAIVNYPDTELFTCEVNRLGQGARCYNKAINNDDSIRNHIQIATTIEYWNQDCEDTIGHLAGFFWCFPKRVWENNKFDDLLIIDKKLGNLQSFDVRWTNEIKGKKRIIKGLYVWHSYRINKHILETDHLE